MEPKKSIWQKWWLKFSQFYEAGLLDLNINQNIKHSSYAYELGLSNMGVVLAHDCSKENQSLEESRTTAFGRDRKK